MKRAFAICAVSAFLLTACGDDESSGFTTRPDEDSSSSVCEDCDDSSSSKNVILSSSEGSSPSSSSSTDKKSSSSSAKSSSSKNGDAKSSSSSAESLSSDASSISFFEDGVTGTMTDGRDGQTYKIVKIGKKIWMAENLNYAYTGVPFKSGAITFDSTSWCYDNDPANCAKYGRLYTWSAAMDSVGRWSTNGKGCGNETTCSPTYPVRGVCPEGWHLPTELEWGMLFILDGYTSTAAERLKSTSGWTDNGNGSDIYSFAVLPAGIRYANGGYAGEGGYAIFWTSDSDDDYYADAEAMSYDSNGVGRYGLYKQEGYSVRCVKDE